MFVVVVVALVIVASPSIAHSKNKVVAGRSSSTRYKTNPKM